MNVDITPSKRMPPLHCSIHSVTYWQVIRFHCRNSLLHM